MVSIANQVNEYVCMVLTVLDEGHDRNGSNVALVRELTCSDLPEMVIGVVSSVFCFNSHMKMAG
jgi:hypothetical protein